MKKLVLGLGFLFTFNFLFPREALARLDELSARQASEEQLINLWGFGPPNSQINLLAGSRNLNQAESDRSGFFLFKQIPLTLAPFCLQAVKENLSTPPLCLPPPASNTSQIENILLPPLLSLSIGKTAVNQPILAKGFTFPRSNLQIFLFQEKNGADFSFPISPLFAAEGAPLKIISDENGYFEFTLPTQTPSTYRVFVGSNFLNNPSPKSTILTFYVLPYWKIFLEELKALLLFSISWFGQLAPAEKVLILEIPLFSFLFLRAFQRLLLKSLIQREVEKL